MEDCVIACTDVYACTEDHVSACMYVSDDNTGLHRSMRPYISTKGTGVHVVIPTEKSKVKTFVRGKTDAYDKCGLYKLVRDISPDVVGKIR